MSTPTYDLIETTTLASAATSVTFSSITQDYRDLVLMVEVQADASVALFLFLNSDSGTNYNYVRMGGNGSATQSNSGSSVSFGIPLYTYSTPDAGESGIYKIQFLDYSATDKHKTILSRSDSVDGTDAIAGRWANTSAITQVELQASNTSALGIGSTFSLYGIASEVI